MQESAEEGGTLGLVVCGGVVVLVLEGGGELDGDGEVDTGLAAGGTGLREVLERHRQALEATKSNIERKLWALDIEVERAGAGPDVVIRQVRSQLIAGLVTSIMPGEDIGPLFEELETVVREARARASRPPGALVALRRGDGPFEVEVFVPVTRSVKMGRVVSRRLPAATVAAVIHRGPYDGMPAFRRSLEEWVVAAGYEPGEQVRLVYLQFGADPELALPEAYLTTRSDDYVTEIQLPVRHPDMALDLPV